MRIHSIERQISILYGNVEDFFSNYGNQFLTKMESVLNCAVNVSMVVFELPSAYLLCFCFVLLPCLAFLFIFKVFFLLVSRKPQ